MWLSNLMSSVGRAVAIQSFGLISQVPALTAAIPGGKLRRLISTAALTDLKYEGIYSQSAYAPWRADEEFRQALAEVRHNTLVDEYRCWELWNLVSQTRNLPEGDILEVGVWRGGTGCLMARRTMLDGGSGAVHLCDTFTGVVKAGGQDSGYVGGEHSDTSKDEVLSLAKRMNLPNVRVHKGMFPDDTGRALGQCRLRLCHIDVDVYESASQTFDWVWPRLTVGGIVIFDDYGFYSCSGVTRFVNRMIGQPDRLVIYNNNGHALVVKLAS
jgi:O-methyltransferase